MAQPVDAVAHDQAHSAGVIVGPDWLAPPGSLGGKHRVGRDVERVVPGIALKFARALAPLPPQRMKEPVRVMDTLRAAPDLGAAHPIRVGVVLGPMDATNTPLSQQLD